MRCPVCNIELKIADRQGVEIDYCPQCRGVWLDRGELDKIMERSAAPPAGRYPDGPDDDDWDDRRSPDQPRRRRKSFLGELFDFD
ncbi:MAG: zf-TFIIB domain-containing protein [Armatimonadetes bacterium]|nr:zf-TFIIB domain-containing protein [Armatimonadota bacterium]